MYCGVLSTVLRCIVHYPSPQIYITCNYWDIDHRSMLLNPVSPRLGATDYKIRDFPDFDLPNLFLIPSHSCLPDVSKEVIMFSLADVLA